MLSAISHELRGPLGVARGYLRMLQSQLGEDAGASKAVEQAGRATDQMAALLDDVSRYARLARGETKLQPEVAALGEVLSAATERVAGTADTPEVAVHVPAGLRVKVDAAHTADSCAALALALGRALLNKGPLAFRQVPGGGPVVTLLPAEARNQGEAAARPIRMDRAAAGLSLAMAELVFRLQGGRLQECWADDRWMGYLLAFPQ